MARDKRNDELMLLKKLYDNSFYPATYNIEKNCFEYPEQKGPAIFYFPNDELKEKALKLSKMKLEVSVEYKNKVEKFLIDLEDNMITTGINGEPIMICPHQFEDCKHRFPYGDGAIGICTYEKCFEINGCLRDIEKEQLNTK